MLPAALVLGYDLFRVRCDLHPQSRRRADSAINAKNGAQGAAILNLGPIQNRIARPVTQQSMRK